MRTRLPILHPVAAGCDLGLLGRSRCAIAQRDASRVIRLGQASGT